MRSKFLMLAPLLAFCAVPARAQAAFADLAEIDNAVSRFTGAPIGVPGGASLPVDRRLRLARCLSPLALSWRGGARDTVLVQCPDAGSWRIFVPFAGNGPQASTAMAVSRGDAVTVAATGDGFSVEQTGEALDSGPVGAWVRVRMGAKADAIRGRIVRPGLVELPME